ncbi:hypothetical protein U9M48_000478 [Paspalum notatum var. saurae]|uniref:Uncharacterized protein n=1 Tax=Paspalum notatum var. saurae TaxID=547442 RepID=A0AAQ3SFZ6_PASNO
MPFLELGKIMKRKLDMTAIPSGRFLNSCRVSSPVLEADVVAGDGEEDDEAKHGVDPVHGLEPVLLELRRHRLPPPPADVDDVEAPGHGHAAVDLAAAVLDALSVKEKKMQVALRKVTRPTVSHRLDGKQLPWLVKVAASVWNASTTPAGSCRTRLLEDTTLDAVALGGAPPPPAADLLPLSVMKLPINIFYTGDYKGYNHSDVMVTNILVWGTTALEYLIGNAKPFLELWRNSEFELWWPNQVAQYNLIGYMVRNRRHRWLRKLAAMLFCKDTLDQLWSMEPCMSSRHISSLVYDHVSQGWREYIMDTATYSTFSDSRGQRTLEREGHPELEHIINNPFDETALVWHLATDICFHTMDIPDEIWEMSRSSRQISNYLVYLLFVNPEMLMTGTRSSLFKTTYTNLKRMVQLTAIEEQELNERSVTAWINQEMQETAPGEGLIGNAFRLADELRDGRMEAGRCNVEDNQRSMGGNVVLLCKQM